MSTLNACHGALGRPFFDHFFASILDSIFDSSWVCFGLVLGAFWAPFGSPNRVKWGQKMDLEASFVRSKSHAFFVLIFDSFWGRLGVVLGPILGTKIDPKIFHLFTLGGLDFDLVV